MINPSPHHADGFNVKGCACAYSEDGVDGNIEDKSSSPFGLQTALRMMCYMRPTSEWQEHITPPIFS